jgi:hypothetical protein
MICTKLVERMKFPNLRTLEWMNETLYEVLQQKNGRNCITSARIESFNNGWMAHIEGEGK